MKLMHAIKRLGLLLCLACSLMLTGCSELKGAKPLAHVSELDGHRVGVVLAWSSDYILSSRKDMAVWRYNSLGDAILALKSARIDALSVDFPYAAYICHQMPAMQIVPGNVGIDGTVAYFNNDEQVLMDQFNAFIADFIHTAEYADIVRRFEESLDGTYEQVDIPVAESDEVLRVVADANCYPFTTWDFVLGECAGCDIDIVRYFGYAIGRRVEVTASTYNAGTIDLSAHRADMMVGALSEQYRADVEMSENALVSVSYLPVDVVLLTIGDPSLLDGVPDL